MEERKDLLIYRDGGLLFRLPVEILSVLRIRIELVFACCDP